VVERLVPEMTKKQKGLFDNQAVYFTNSIIEKMPALVFRLDHDVEIHVTPTDYLLQYLSPGADDPLMLCTLNIKFHDSEEFVLGQPVLTRE